MLQRQAIAPQVIYTTHSAGALPEDLAAVRSIAPVNGVELSEMKNWFWTGSEPGVLSLLLRMGASTMAFLPTRNAVVVEGPSDMLLLPAITKDATGVESLDFQSVPGLAEANDKQLRILDHAGSSVVFVTDADEAGKKLERRLQDQGIGDDRILSVSERKGWSIEDLLRADVYVRAVNDVIEVYTPHRLTDSDLATPGRSRSVDSWCNDQSISAPSKRAVAQAVRRIRHEDQIAVVSDDSVEEVRRLYERIKHQLEQMSTD
jgi:predicted ATP-dependent endonuclease of OLD family